MELIDVLVLLCLGFNIVLFLFIIYLYAKMSGLEIRLKNQNSPEKALENMMKGKVPVLKNKETGEFFVPNSDKKQVSEENSNPITG